MILHSCQINAVLPYVRELHNMISPHGKIWLYARNVILSKKNAAWDIYWRVWKRNIRGHAENCLLIICSSRGCIVFSPIFLSNFLGGCPNHEKINKKCTLGWYPEVWLSRHGLTLFRKKHIDHDMKSCALILCIYNIHFWCRRKNICKHVFVLWLYCDCIVGV